MPRGVGRRPKRSRDPHGGRRGRRARPAMPRVGPPGRRRPVARPPTSRGSGPSKSWPCSERCRSCGAGMPEGACGRSSGSSAASPSPMSAGTSPTSGGWSRPPRAARPRCPASCDPRKGKHEGPRTTLPLTGCSDRRARGARSAGLAPSPLSEGRDRHVLGPERRRRLPSVAGAVAEGPGPANRDCSAIPRTPSPLRCDLRSRRRTRMPSDVSLWWLPGRGDDQAEPPRSSSLRGGWRPG